MPHTQDTRFSHFADWKKPSSAATKPSAFDFIVVCMHDAHAMFTLESTGRENLGSNWLLDGGLRHIATRGRKTSGKTTLPSHFPGVADKVFSRVEGFGTASF